MAVAADDADGIDRDRCGVFRVCAACSVDLFAVVACGGEQVVERNVDAVVDEHRSWPAAYEGEQLARRGGGQYRGQRDLAAAGGDTERGWGEGGEALV